MAVCAAFAPGLEIITYILSQPHPIQFVATCHTDTSRFEKQIAALCRQKKIKLYRHINVNEESFKKIVTDHKIDIMFLAWWPTIVHQPALVAAKIGWINIHPSYLPYGRGMHPYYWSVVEEVPYGVTLHFIDSEIDKGRILFQRRIPIVVTDTGESLYAKALRTSFDLFRYAYPKIVRREYKTRSITRTKQKLHFTKDIEAHSAIKLNKRYTARELLNIIRARTFRSGASAFFYHQGKKYWVRLDVSPAPPDSPNHWRRRKSSITMLNI